MIERHFVVTNASVCGNANNILRILPVVSTVSASMRSHEGANGLAGVERLPRRDGGGMGAAGGGGWGGGEDNHDHGRESLSSNFSDEDWEVVQKRDSIVAPEEVAAGRSTGGGVVLPTNVLARAGDWLQWGFDGAVKGVEKTCDGIKGVW